MSEAPNLAGIVEALEAAKAVLPELSPQAHDRIYAAKERCDALVGNAKRQRARLLQKAELVEDVRRSRLLRNRACSVLQAAKDAAAVQLLDAQAEEYIPLTRERFPHQTLEVLAQTSVQMYGGDDAVELRMCEWRARWLDRKAAKEPEHETAERQDSQHRREAAPQTAERRALVDEYKAKARASGISVTDKMIAEAAKPGKWNDRTMVTWWKRNDSRIQPTHDRLIRTVLKKDPRSLWPQKQPR